MISYNSMVILHNKIKCNHCGDIIESYNVHDFKYCKCNTVFVDGGHEYLRRGFNEKDDYTELSESVAINEHGVNKNIKYRILSKDKMEQLGFEKVDANTWYYNHALKKHRKYNKKLEISLNIFLPDNGEDDIDIRVLYDDSLQSYDYQYILAQPESCNNKVALAVRDEIEGIIEKMQEADVLSGHKKGDYI